MLTLFTLLALQNKYFILSTIFDLSLSLFMSLHLLLSLSLLQWFSSPGVHNHVFSTFPLLGALTSHIKDS